MVDDGFLRIFWPYNLTRSTAPGVIVGFRNSDFDIFVVSVLDFVEVSWSCGMEFTHRFTNRFC